VITKGRATFEKPVGVGIPLASGKKNAAGQYLGNFTGRGRKKNAPTMEKTRIIKQPAGKRYSNSSMLLIRTKETENFRK